MSRLGELMVKVAARIDVPVPLSKTARIWSHTLPNRADESLWSDNFRGSPFYEEAQAHEAREAQLQAMQEMIEARHGMARSKLRVSQTQLEAKLLAWKAAPKSNP